MAEQLCKKLGSLDHLDNILAPDIRSFQTRDIINLDRLQDISLNDDDDEEGREDSSLKEIDGMENVPLKGNDGMENVPLKGNDGMENVPLGERVKNGILEDSVSSDEKFCTVKEEEEEEESADDSAGSSEDGRDEVVPIKCPKHSKPGTPDLSSDSSGAEDISVMRRERRMRRKRKKNERLKRCCGGCTVDGELSPVSSDLPSPLATSSGMLQCNVIQPFEKVVSELYNSEEEIDAAIQSYSTVGCRLAHKNQDTFSDPDTAKHSAREQCSSPVSDPDLLVCDYSNSVGKKLANRTNSDRILDTEIRKVDSIEDYTVEELNKLLDALNYKLQVTNEELVEEVKESDSLAGQRTIILKHIAELTSLAQGKRATDASAFRKIVVSRETHF